ncbi:MAG TPA: hypothetical protein VI756_15050, partial [Blastocatellia bacterium]
MSEPALGVKSKTSLPEGFRDLERFVEQGWCAASERERNAKRLSSQMIEIQEVYDTLLPRMDDIIGYLNRFPVDQIPEDGTRLLRLSFSLAEIAPAVEFYGQPRVVDGFPPERFVPVEVPHMTPT